MSVGDRVFLGGISRDATNDDVDDVIRKNGEPREIHHTGKGFSFVQFGSNDEAQAFVDKIQGQELCGMRLRPEISKPRDRSGGGGGSTFIPADKWNSMTPAERDEARAKRGGGGGQPAKGQDRRDDKRRDDSRDRRRRDSPRRRRRGSSSSSSGSDRKGRRRDDSRDRRRKDSRSPKRRKDSRSPRRERRRSRS